MSSNQQRRIIQEYESNLVYLVQTPRAGCMPSLSPFALKLETWLRMAEIPYQNVDNQFKYKSLDGHCPFVELEGRQIVDSNIIINELTAHFGVCMDEIALSERTPTPTVGGWNGGSVQSVEEISLKKLADFFSYRSLIEDTLRWKCKYYRALNNKFYGTNDGVGAHFTGFKKFFLKHCYLAWLRRKTMNACRAQGIGMLPVDKVDSFTRRELRALSIFLGEKRYFLGENYSTMYDKNDEVLPVSPAQIFSYPRPDCKITVPDALSSVEMTEKSTNSTAGTSIRNEPIVRENGVSATATLINFLKGMIGPGCLSLPLAFKQAGLLTALCLIIVFGFLNNYCMIQLVHCSQRLSKRKGDAPMDYGTVAYEACAESFKSLRKYKKYARLIVNTAIIALQIGVCSVFYVFIATHLKEICEEMSDVRISQTSWMLLILVPMILICMLRTLKTIAVISAVGNILMIASLIFIFQFLLRAEHHWSDLPWITNFNGVMAACGSILYSFEGQAMVLPMENRLKHPSDMVGPFGVLSVGMTSVTAIYAIAGLAGYVTYGECVRGSITQSLPNELIFLIVRVMLTMVIYFGYVIQQYVIVDMMWPHIRKTINIDSGVDRYRVSSTASSAIFNSKSIAETSNAGSMPSKYPYPQMREFGAEFLFRTGVVFVTMLIAILVPNLDDIIPLVGVTAGMLLAFIFPATIDLILFAPELLEEGGGRVTTRLVLRIAQDLCLCLVGAFGLMFGLRSNINTIFLDHVQ